MKELDKYYEANRKMWDQFAKINVDSKTYKTQSFLEGTTSLNSIELEEVGDVKGKSLLHLQSHFGLDALSWAREGANVTGVDFSGEGISIARNLAKKANIDAQFIQSNIFDLPDVLDEQFDIVYTSYGVLVWLHDLKRWAEIVGHFLKPGGTFYIAEMHPFLWPFDSEHKEDFKFHQSYFPPLDGPYAYEVDGSYAESDKKIEPQLDYEWCHTMAVIVSAIARAGLRIQFLHEFNKCPFQLFPFFKKKDDGYYYYDHPEIQLPLVFSIKATKE